ncbi:transmembrane protein 14C-like [Thalassophryne amazonica]|uniref:transmembrane protein 14C-like n=1 Tax=Thalassophryne amazonica TaxID=390379 RepID=UPI0014709299|nr:transmembrane protein 14C-like [Thalassophryne amazonica]
MTGGCSEVVLSSFISAAGKFPLMAVDWIGFSYAALVSAGGVMGYVKAGSVASLWAGLLFGLMAALGSYLLSQNAKNVWLLLGTSGTLAVVMGMRFISSWKFMPSGLMTLASVLMLLKITSGMKKKPNGP